MSKIKFAFSLVAMLAMCTGVLQPLSAAKKAQKKERRHKHSSSSSSSSHSDKAEVGCCKNHHCNKKVKGNLTVCGDAKLCSNVEVKRDLTVRGTTVLEKELAVKGNTVLEKDLAVKGNALLEKDLAVKGNAVLEKDLTVAGCIYNEGLDLINQTALLPPSDEVYNQYQLIGSTRRANVLENVKENSISRDLIVPGTEPELGSVIFGYNDDQTLDINGGSVKSYNSNFTQFNWRYNAPNTVVDLTNDALVPAMERIISYYVQRGFQVTPEDIPEGYEHQFVGLLGTGQQQNTTRPYIGVNLVFNVNEFTHVDLMAYDLQSTPPLVIDLYEPNIANKQNGHVYPLRIPVTTDLCEFTELKDLQPIVYYDKVRRNITIEVPETSPEFLQYSLSTTKPFSSSRQAYLQSFSASYNLARRGYNNEVVSSSPFQATILTQASDLLSFKTRVINNAVESFRAFTAPRLTSNDLYNGQTCQLLNSTTPSYDIYVFPGPVDGFEVDLDPFQLPSQSGFAQGDNPYTKLVELLSLSSRVQLFDTPLWQIAARKIDEKVFKALTYPEQVNNALVTPPSVPTTVTESNLFIQSHEYAHSIQDAMGVQQFVNVEGTAAGIEMDPKLSDSVTWPGARGYQYALSLLKFVRGEFQLLQNPAFPIGYGMAPAYKYIADQFDPNNQVVRRTLDILNTQQIGPYAIANDLPNMAFINPSNTAGTSLSFKQAMNELYGKDIRDVFQDFAISLSMLRNNTNIPAQYRSNFPYWLYNSQYTGYAGFQESMEVTFNSIFGIPGYNGTANWWEVLDNETLVPANWNVLGLIAPYVGQTFFPTLSDLAVTKEVKDMSLLIYNLPTDTTQVSVEAQQGEWRLAVVYFESDGTPAGIFQIDGPHVVNPGDTQVFDVTVFPSNKMAKLVCANVTITDGGTVDANFFAPAPNSGKIKIARTI